MDSRDDFEREARAWARRVGPLNFDGIKRSGLFVWVFNEHTREEALPCLQLGLAIMMDKPIVVVAREDARIPATLRRIAKRIEVCDGSVDGFAKAIMRVEEYVRGFN